MAPLTYLLSIMIGLALGAFFVRTMTVALVEFGGWPELKPKHTPPERPTPKVTARDAVVGRMGFSGRGLTIIRSAPALPETVDVDEGCSYCTM